MGNLRSGNITPDSETGIGKWSAYALVPKFKSYQNKDFLEIIAINNVNTILPWSLYAQMDTTDVKAIYTYLKTLKPLQNHVIPTGW